MSQKPNRSCLVASLLFFLAARTCLGVESWPQWRGPNGTGTASANASPPETWAEDENVLWKIPIPGLGHSTPIVWDDRVFVTTAVPEGKKQEPKFSGAPGAHDNLPVSQAHSFCVLAIRRKDGKILWNTNTKNVIPHEGGHNSASLASASPITDGRHIFASFGSHGLVCLDYQGQLVWQRSLGKMNTKHGHGEGSSPVLFDDRIIINWDHEGQSFIMALNKSGQPIWKKQRDEVTSWSSPIVVPHQGQNQVIVCGTEKVRAYDLKNGDIIWECGGLSANIVATPVAANGIVYVGSSYEIRSLMAIKLDGSQGDITNSKQILWRRRTRTPYVPSPLLYNDQLYFLTHYQNILSRVEGPTGEEPIGPFRLGALGNIYASPVAADGKIYITDLDGTTLVMSAGKIPRPIAVNRLDESIAASAAIVGKQILLRGRNSLYCISDKTGE